MQIATGTKVPIVVGEIRPTGNVTLNLDQKLFKNIQSDHDVTVESFNESHAEGMEMKTSNLQDIFPVCMESIEYDLNFKPGWNLVKTEVVSVVKDIYGDTHPLDMKYSAIDKVPNDIFLQVKIR